MSLMEKVEKRGTIVEIKQLESVDAKEITITKKTAEGVVVTVTMPDGQKIYFSAKSFSEITLG